jgi:hypothetical protein
MDFSTKLIWTIYGKYGLENMDFKISDPNS